MNDFTIKELKEIYYAISECHYIPPRSEKPPLLIKIGNMIDNYCEHECDHESDGIEHTFGNEGGCFVMRKCKKCGAFYR